MEENGGVCMWIVKLTEVEKKILEKGAVNGRVSARV